MGTKQNPKLKPVTILPFLVRHWPTRYQNFRKSKHFQIHIVKLGFPEFLGQYCHDNSTSKYCHFTPFWQHWPKISGNPNLTNPILKCLLFWKFWYLVGHCRTRNGEMGAISNFWFIINVPTYCDFLIFGVALPPFKATVWQLILLRHQSNDISALHRSKWLKKMLGNNGWCHFPETRPCQKMDVPFFWDGGSTKVAHFLRFLRNFKYDLSSIHSCCHHICWSSKCTHNCFTRGHQGLVEKC